MKRQVKRDCVIRRAIYRNIFLVNDADPSWLVIKHIIVECFNNFSINQEVYKDVVRFKRVKM